MNIVELIDITLHNYKIHRNLTVAFKSGVTGIIGTNGKGKSTIVSAIQFLFTGELDVDSKAEAITLGESEGWVSGHLLLHGKPAYLERHLSTSKVVLEYDGKRYIKSADVKELWSKLLQIDSIVFRNVIVAGQGEIQLLFNGEAAVRERIFQKIFLVPPTEKLRNTIWGYMKNCPPEIPEEDIPQLEASQATLAATHNQLGRQIDQVKIHLLPAVAVDNLLGRIQYLQGCEQDLKLRPTLEEKLAQLNATLVTNMQQLRKLADELDAVPIEEFKASRNELLMQKGRAQQQAGLLARYEKMIALLPAGFDTPALQQLQAEAQGLQEKVNTTRTELALLAAKQKELTAELVTMQQLDGKSQCPTCRQPVVCTAEHLTQQREALAANVEKQKQLTLQLHQDQKASSNASNRAQELQTILQSADEASAQLAGQTKLVFHEEDLAVFTEAIARYEEQQKQRNQAQQLEARLNGEIGVINTQLAALKRYNGSMLDATEELTLMLEVQQENNRRQEEIRQLETRLAVVGREMELIQARITASAINHEKNARRAAYLQVLQGVYDLMHSSEFPRALIQSYSQYVEYYLKLNLENFAMPFQVSLGESFNLVVKDELNRVLPGVSGGQAVVLGICLRLALHKLFAQSFPIWIVDEGTTHLDAKNRKLYFQLIEALKRDATINQIIIIDHDPMLSTVVDQTVEL